MIACVIIHLYQKHPDYHVPAEEVEKMESRRQTRMKHPERMMHENYPDTHHDAYSRTVFGFWLYLMTDFILFGALFATYAVLSHSTFGGPICS